MISVIKRVMTLNINLVPLLLFCSLPSRTLQHCVFLPTHSPNYSHLASSLPHRLFSSPVPYSRSPSRSALDLSHPVLFRPALRSPLRQGLISRLEDKTCVKSCVPRLNSLILAVHCGIIINMHASIRIH